MGPLQSSIYNARFCGPIFFIFFPRRNTEVPSKVLALATLILATQMLTPLVVLLLMASMRAVSVRVPMGSTVPMVPMESMVQVARGGGGLNNKNYFCKKIDPQRKHMNVTYKGTNFKRKIVLQPALFKGYVRFWGVIYLVSSLPTWLNFWRSRIFSRTNRLSKVLFHGPRWMSEYLLVLQSIRTFMTYFFRRCWTLWRVSSKDRLCYDSFCIWFFQV